MFFFIAVLLVIIYVWPGMYKRMKPTAREAQFWGNVCSTVGNISASLKFPQIVFFLLPPQTVLSQVAKSSSFAKASGLYDYLVVESTTAQGELQAKVRLAAPLQNTLQSLHGGAAALIVDELTTVSIMSQRCFPGVTLSLSLQYLAGCNSGDVITVTSRVLRLGLKVVHTECEFRSEGGVLLVRASHVKYCAAPRPWLALLWMRTSVAEFFLPLVMASTPNLLTKLPPAVPTTTKPFAEEKKKGYFASFGEGVDPAAQLVGFDLALAGAELRRTGQDTFVLGSPKEVGNPSGALHGGCTAMIVDALGTSALARHSEASGGSCGVSTNLEVQYGAAGKGKLEFVTTVLNVGNRVATVKVIARDAKNRLVAQGTMTKYGKFKSME